jgi:hypothetical protein
MTGKLTSAEQTLADDPNLDRAGLAEEDDPESGSDQPDDR